MTDGPVIWMFLYRNIPCVSRLFLTLEVSSERRSRISSLACTACGRAVGGNEYFELPSNSKILKSQPCRTINKLPHISIYIAKSMKTPSCMKEHIQGNVVVHGDRVHRLNLGDGPYYLHHSIHSLTIRSRRFKEPWSNAWAKQPVDEP